MIELTETQIKNKEIAEGALNKMFRNMKRAIALEDLESACRDYLDAQEMLKDTEDEGLDEAEDEVAIALEDLEGMVKECEANGATSKEVDGMLKKYGLSRAEISSSE